ncbi:Serine/threonine-protein kinase BUD32 [Jaminaea rosea]|uniref:EKC/KEOPS complex subunit BUD32 n=1 Tax=Jaminaea rosea TaxID=1569628 RepID=A0A316V055_9BASI|nr:Serine/threonine-protein kinase BUD32 [Jaminaea rosea]PWN30929.1 Serine/threonine-protein kinase BUD32 [Jaminaea rosea]
MASAEAGPSSASPLLRLLSDPSSSTLIKQGAEAKVYRSYPCGPASSSSPPSWLLKYRFPKTYRHPHLSQTITAQRTVSEARALVRCARYGVEVPVVELVDEKEGILALEWIEGASVREWLGGGAEDDESSVSTRGEVCLPATHCTRLISPLPCPSVQLMTAIGHQLALMHAADVIHGDLTTSNLMVRSTPTSSLSAFRVVLIDFGLSFSSASTEDKAVDLYVLERAFLSTHPHSAHLFQRVLESYGERIGQLWRDPWRDIRKRLDEVRMRGRKRSMVG